MHVKIHLFLFLFMEKKNFFFFFINYRILPIEEKHVRTHAHFSFQVLTNGNIVEKPSSRAN
jgi:hypothetical protein